MRYMGIDYGTKRVGVALSDGDGMMGFPHSVIANDAELIEKLVKLARAEKVDAIVIGASRNREGDANPVQKHIDECTERLKEWLKVPIYTEPEMYSTQEALRDQGRTLMTDASAATIILNSYLTKHKPA